MALETLNNIDKINEFNVVVMDDLREVHPDKFNDSGSMDYKWFESEIRPHNYIYVRHDVNSLSFTLQNGPIKDNGVNGCQVDEIIGAAKLILEGLNANFPCNENTMAIAKLEDSLMWLDRRKADRTSRGVEGKNLK